MKTAILASAILITCSLPACGQDAAEQPPANPLPPAVAESLAACNVVWDSPSADARGSMPIGNGDIGLNVWVEPSGDLLFFIGKTDAWDENMRLLKLGKVRVKFTPALATANGFRQELKLRDGVIEIQNEQAQVSVWVDANHPVIQVDAKSLTGQPLEARASFEVWRKEKRSLGQSRERWRQRILLHRLHLAAGVFVSRHRAAGHRRSASAGIIAMWIRPGCRA